VARVEGHEGLELLDGLVELSLTVVRLADQEPGAGRVGGLRMPLRHLAERRARLFEAALAQLALAFRIQLLCGRQRLRSLAKEIRKGRAPAQQQEESPEW